MLRQYKGVSYISLGDQLRPMAQLHFQDQWKRWDRKVAIYKSVTWTE